MRLFVDCDDTLVLWQPEKRTRSDGLYLGNEWERNEKLIKTIEDYIDQMTDIGGKVELIIWSDGGKEYARMWAKRFFPEKYWVARDKDPTLPQDEDICIDDIMIRPPSTALVLTADQFIYIRSWIPNKGGEKV